MIAPTGLFLAVFPLSPPAPPSSAIRLEDVTATSGLEAVMTSGAAPSRTILEVKGGGLALVDFDSDGDLDLFLPNGATLESPRRGPGARLFRNDSVPGSIRFSDATAAGGIRHAGWSFGVAAGDVDGDGHDDLFIACHGPNVLLRNRGDGTFEDITGRAGVAGGDDEWSTGAAFADLDLDGDLDLFVANYLKIEPAVVPPPARFKGVEVIAGPKGLAPQRDRLFLNDGTGRFTDATEASGIAAAKPSYGLNVAILDLVGDGRPDIFVGNDSEPSHLFRGETAPDGSPRFVETGVRSGVATNGEGLAQATMGIAIGDVDGNGRPDLFTTNFSSDTNTLHLNADGAFFDDRTARYGVGAPSRRLCGWAAAFLDLDHDGDEDLLMVNGHVYPNATRESMDSEYAQPPLLLERVGGKFLVRTGAGPWTLEPHRDRTAVFADLDRDGAVDAVIGELNGPLRVVRGLADPSRSLAVGLRDARPGVGNRHAIGATVTARSRDASGGELVQRRWLWGGGPFQSTLSPEVHFGFPAGTATVDLEVRWPDGTTTRREGLAPGSPRVTIDRTG
jgi:hypothetical protein